MKTLGKRQIAYDLFEQMKNNEILLSYFGTLSFDMAKYLIDNLKLSLRYSELERMVAKKIFSSFVEGIENVVKHKSPDLLSPADYGIVNVSKVDNNFVINIGNIVANNNKMNLIKSLDIIKDKAVDELKEEYRQKMLAGEMTDEGNAGMGIIQMAINCDGNLDYYFYELDHKEEFFILEMIIEN